MPVYETLRVAVRGYDRPARGVYGRLYAVQQDDGLQPCELVPINTQHELAAPSEGVHWGKMPSAKINLLALI